MDIASLLQPSEDERRKAALQGLLTAGLGIMANNRGPNAGMAIGAGGLLGMQGQQQALTQGRQDAMQRLQMGLLMQRQQEEQARKREIDRLLNPQPISPEQAGSMPGGPTVGNAAMIGQGQQGGLAGMPLDQARYLRAFGGDDAVAKAFADRIKPSETERLINLLPPEQRQIAVRSKAGIAPQFVQSDQGGRISYSTFDPVDQTLRQIQERQKTAAPGAIPFEFSDLTPAGARIAGERKAASGAARINQNVNTEKKYGEAFASKIADADVSMRDSAMKAPALAERANSIKQILASGQVITGTGADYRLAFGKAAKLAGINLAGDAIANTETLATMLAQNTMDAIRASGLGGGTGFSNADRDFLEKAVGGKITYDKQTLNRLADLAHRAASLSAERWNKRAKEIPASALEGTGIKTDPVDIAPVFGGGASSSSVIDDLVKRYANGGR